MSRGKSGHEGTKARRHREIGWKVAEEILKEIIPQRREGAEGISTMKDVKGLKGKTKNLPDLQALHGEKQQKLSASAPWREIETENG